MSSQRREQSRRMPCIVQTKVWWGNLKQSGSTVALIVDRRTNRRTESPPTGTGCPALLASYLAARPASSMVRNKPLIVAVMKNPPLPRIALTHTLSCDTYATMAQERPQSYTGLPTSRFFQPYLPSSRQLCIYAWQDTTSGVIE